MTDAERVVYEHVKGYVGVAPGTQQVGTGITLTHEEAWVLLGTISRLQAIEDRLRDEAAANKCASLWESYGRAGAGMALTDYRRFVLAEEET